MISSNSASCATVAMFHMPKRRSCASSVLRRPTQHRPQSPPDVVEHHGLGPNVGVYAIGLKQIAPVSESLEQESYERRLRLMGDGDKTGMELFSVVRAVI